jgi:hypothetical protein
MPKLQNVKVRYLFCSYASWVKFTVQGLSSLKRDSNINLKSLRLTLCTTSFHIKKFCVLPTMRLCVLCGSENKQRLFLYTAITYRFFITEAESVY